MIAHIGFPKSGTTFLQKEVFPKLPFRYAGFDTCVDLFYEVVYLDPTMYYPDVISARIKGSRYSLFSYECLVGQPYLYKGQGRTNIANFLKFAGIQKIIITTREKEECLDSAYNQFLKMGGVISKRRFLYQKEMQDEQSRTHAVYFDPRYFDYKPVVELYKSLFGEGNVLVLPYELLQNEPERYLKTLCSFLECPVPVVSFKRHNERLRYAFFLRFFNRFLYTALKPYSLFGRWLSTWKIQKLIEWLP